MKLRETGIELTLMEMRKKVVELRLMKVQAKLRMTGISQWLLGGETEKIGT